MVERSPVRPGSSPLVSVAMPVCDNERFVEEAVRSLLGQTLLPDEIVIGDDGSQDGTSAILADLARAHPVIRLLRRDQRSGLANAANWVLGAARGDLVALAHGDDISHPERLSRQVAVMDSVASAVLVGAPAVGIDEQGRQVHPANLWRLARPSVFAPFAHSSVMYRREAFAAVGGYRVQAEYWEDLDLFWRLSQHGKLLALPEAITSYRYSGDSFRVRDRLTDVELAIQLVYQRADHAAAGRVTAALGHADAPASPKLRPRVFVACSWTSVWRARRPGTWRRMLRHGHLRPNVETLQALVFVGGGTIAPRLFRLALQAAAAFRNTVARRLLRDRVAIEWNPFGGQG